MNEEIASCPRCGCGSFIMTKDETRCQSCMYVIKEWKWS